jgi:hypothetical protein
VHGVSWAARSGRLVAAESIQHHPYGFDDWLYLSETFFAH